MPVITETMKRLTLTALGLALTFSGAGLAEQPASLSAPGEAILQPQAPCERCPAGNGNDMSEKLGVPYYN
ncbi:multiple antibiotic resistance regulatory protein MarB [Intestinirhabdus alba]|jgi:hypothetical protein|uniref:Multiple antibiotic resistance regulatory protein MarB n=1 Tax=Intestinirhabdus alba TaxID=2899544 RepID=A0A6L6IJN4_9ENTR|nr:multiple antibiotic resistance regulatory protein MarB [Intestinirhabdus alba]MTH46077.1 multiple antibiotic resistance regulatory protein MarB [Intestinirhabdus alba]